MRVAIGILLCNLLLVVARKPAQLKLELLQVIFRHGDRYTTKEDREVVGSDSYDATFENFTEWGLLTQAGKVREYDIGKMLRSRYNNFLGDYKSAEVYARSTNIDRTKSSLLLLLAGLYPPTTSTRWNSKIDWQPIPIYSEPLASDPLRVDYQGPCLKNGKMLDEAQAVPEIAQKMEKYRGFYEQLKKKIQISEFTPLEFFSIHSYVRSIVGLNWPLPTWCSQEDYKTLEEATSIFYEALTYGVPMRKAVVGALIGEVAEKIRNDTVSEGKKIYLYSTHDANLGSYLRAQNFSNIPALPDYGSAVMVEKLRGTNDNIYVRMYYWTGVSQKIIPLKIFNCGYVCSLKKYEKLIYPIIPNEEEMQCYYENTSTENTTEEKLR